MYIVFPDKAAENHTLLHMENIKLLRGPYIYLKVRGNLCLSMNNNDIFYISRDFQHRSGQSITQSRTRLSNAQKQKE